MNHGGIIDADDMELEVEPGEAIVPADDLRRAIGGIDEWSQTESENLHRVAIVAVGRRNGKEVDVQIAQLAAAAGITMAELDEALRRVGELVAQAAAAAAEMLNALIQTVNDVYAPGLAEAWEEIQKLIEQYEYADGPEEEDRHDGAVEVLVTWLLPVPSLYELYGQGVDHGGPGPSRLTLIRVTDDGLRRAETGTKQERRQRNATEKGLQAGRGVRPGHRDRMGERHETRRPHEPGADRADHAAA